MRYHIITTTGEPGVCTAKEGNCPYGKDAQHFTSKEAAREAFEASNSASTFSMSLSDMNAKAKFTYDHEIIAGIIENGSDRTLNNLAKNPNLTDQEVRAALAKTTNVSVRSNLLVANGGPHELMTPDDLEETLFRIPAKDRNSPTPFYRAGDKLSKLINNPSLTDAHFERVLASSRLTESMKKRMMVALSEDNNISPQKTRDYLEAHNWSNYPINSNNALLNGKITEQDLMDAPDQYVNNFTSTGFSPKFTTKEVDTLGRVGVKKGNSRLQMWAARDLRTSSNVLDTMGRHNIEVQELFKNPNVSAHIKAEIATRNAEEPFVRMSELADKVGPEEFKSIMTSGGYQKLGRSYGETYKTFDMEKVRKYELTNDDIFYLAGSSSYNAGQAFNPETGVFTGRGDSSD